MFELRVGRITGPSIEQFEDELLTLINEGDVVSLAYDDVTNMRIFNDILPSS